MVGQDILKEDFGQGGFSLVMLEGMSDKDVAATADRISAVEHVSDVICYQSMTGCNIPREILPDNIYSFFNHGDNTMMAVFFDDTTSADGTLAAVEEMRNITSKQCFISGMSAITLDMKNITQNETLIYALIAVILTSIVLTLTMDSFLIPVFFMLSIGFAVVWNLGSNILFGEISFITQALAMVLQLGVTMDYSIFGYYGSTLNHGVYDLLRDMGNRIYANNVSSVYNNSSLFQNSFFGIKYIIDRGRYFQFRSGKGYTSVEENSDCVIWENDTPFPIAFASSRDLLDMELTPDNVRGVFTQNEMINRLCGEEINGTDESEYFA